MELEEEGRIDEAIDWCNRALSWDDDPVAYDIRAGLYQKKGDVQRAIMDYNFAIELDLDFASWYAHRATAHEQAGDLRSATKDYCRAILTNPGNTSGPHTCARIRANRRGPDTLDEMIAFFERALETYPEDKEIADSLRILRRAQEED